MSKYIDADKLIAEIERLKERAQAERVLHPQTILSAKNYLLIKDYDTLLSIIASLQQEQPSLPSNLDEAAQKVEGYYDVCEESGYLCCNRGDIKDAFKAGAEWLAGQGVTKEAVIGMATEEISITFSRKILDKLDLCPGDKVVVQVRKEDAK